MVKISISKGTIDIFYIGKDEKVGEGEFTPTELALLQQIMDSFWSYQRFVKNSLHSSVTKEM